MEGWTVAVIVACLCATGLFVVVIAAYVKLKGSRENSLLPSFKLKGRAADKKAPADAGVHTGLQTTDVKIETQVA